MLARMGNLRQVALALAAALVLSCGGSQHGPAAHDTAPSVKMYKPLEAKADTKNRSQAVILGTDAKDGSTVMQLPDAPSKSLVDAMYVKLGGKSGDRDVAPSGGFSPVKLSVAPNTDGSVQVGVAEEYSGGAGEQWRAGVWVSAFVAASTLGKDLTDYTFLASSGGYIDGASASGLMAGGFLAAMTGTPVDPTVTMTGIINPDGTIGPVGGIPEKFLGSIEQGKKRLGYPIGMRYAKSEASKQMVDLVQLAKDHGAEAVEIANVREAYHLLTGKDLPEVVPVSEDEMKLDDATAKTVDGKTLEREKQMAAVWTTIVQLDSAGKLPATLKQMAELAHTNEGEAKKLLQQGYSAAAYAKMMAAWAYSIATATTYDVMTKAQAGDVDGAIKSLDQLAALGGATEDVFKKVGAMKPTTLGGHMRMLAAFQSALRGWGASVYGESNVERAKGFMHGLSEVPSAELGGPDAAEQIVNNVATATLLLGRRIAENTLATDFLDFDETQKVSYLCSLPNVVRLSTSFQSASAAAITYFDSLLVTPLAKEANLSEDAAKERVAMVEPDYMVAIMTAHLPDASGLPADLKAAWGEHSLAWGLMSLAGNELAYYDSAQLIAKYYSLGVKDDQVEHEKAFMNMLANAERTAREAARAARIATGAIPMEAKLAYQLATVDREGTIADKLNALSGFWQSSAYSQTAVMLARN
jgi:hypothetical protein